MRDLSKWVQVKYLSLDYMFACACVGGLEMRVSECLCILTVVVVVLSMSTLYIGVVSVNSWCC